jgi:NAD(P)-dependent dehydrogenase (short-subunit alcohol dehydrogenase family)
MTGSPSPFPVRGKADHLPGLHLLGQSAVVSGVARPPGIGRATALRLAGAGANVVCAELVGEDSDDNGATSAAAFAEVVREVREAAKATGAEVVACPQSDVAPPAWNRLIQSALDAFGRLDICCSLNGATGAAAGDGRLLDVTAQAWQRSLDLNVSSALFLSQAACRAMIEAGRGGVIVQLSSASALIAKENNGAVGSARSAVDYLIAVLAREVGPSGIRCTAVAPLGVQPAPGYPNAGLLGLAAREGGGSLAEWARRRIPLGRVQDPDETAAVIEFLCSDAASFVSGVTVPVYGGANW